MKAPYLIARGRSPLPSLAGSLLRPRPVIAVRVSGPGQTRLLDGLLDTGSDETVFEEGLAAALGIDLRQAEERQVGRKSVRYGARTFLAPSGSSYSRDNVWVRFHFPLSSKTTVRMLGNGWLSGVSSIIRATYRCSCRGAS